MPTQTPILALNLPVVGADDDVWGDQLNANFLTLDSVVLTPSGGDARYLPLIGGTLGGALSIDTGTPILNLRKPVTGGTAYIAGTVGQARRWLMEFGNASPEGTGNAGSDFLLSRYNNAGGVLDTPLHISRATGAATFAQSVSVATTLSVTGNIYTNGTVAATGVYITGSAPSGGIDYGNSLFLGGTYGNSETYIRQIHQSGVKAAIQFVVQGTPGQVWEMRNDGTFFTPTLAVASTITATNIGAANIVTGNNGVFASSDNDHGFYTSGNSRYHRWTAGWVDRFDMATGDRAWLDYAGQGNMSLSAVGNLYVRGSVSCTGSLNANSQLVVSGPSYLRGTIADISSIGSGWTMYAAAGYRNIQFLTNYALRWAESGGTLDWIAGGTRVMYLDAAGQFVLSVGNGWKPGGGPWADTSDARIKTVDGEYSAGLSEVCALRPVRYRFKGNDAAPQISTGIGEQLPAAEPGHPTDRTFIGLIAQEVENTMPEMVLTRSGWVDGEPVDDLRMLDATALPYALVNSCKQLAEMLQAQDARIAALEAAQ